MILKIFRGTNEIGGTCVQLSSGRTRLIIDLGAPLVDKNRKPFDFDKYANLSVPALIREGVLPDIDGLYGENNPVDAVILSHAHADHFGLIGYINPAIPVYLGDASHRILELNNIFQKRQIFIKNPVYFERNKPFTIGDFTVRPYWADHSSFDAYSFLIEAAGKRIFYSGDFRGHGRKHKIYKWFIDHAPKNIDCLLMEGTQIGRLATVSKTEEDLEQELFNIFNEPGKVNLIYTSGQNIDRLVSVYKACRFAGKTFVPDIYTVIVLDALSEYAKLPNPLKGYSDIRVLYPFGITKKLYQNNHGDLAERFKLMKAKKEIIEDNPSKYVITVRPSMKPDIAKMNLKGGNLIYSMWSGYKTEKSTGDFLDWLSSRGFTIHEVHTSGHTNVDTLKEFADAIDPNVIVPIHTFNKKEYKNIFAQRVIELNDKEEYSI